MLQSVDCSVSARARHLIYPSVARVKDISPITAIRLASLMTQQVFNL